MTWQNIRDWIAAEKQHRAAIASSIRIRWPKVADGIGPGADRRIVGEWYALKIAVIALSAATLASCAKQFAYLEGGFDAKILALSDEELLGKIRGYQVTNIDSRVAITGQSWIVYRCDGMADFYGTFTPYTVRNGVVCFEQNNSDPFCVRVLITSDGRYFSGRVDANVAVSQHWFEYSRNRLQTCEQ